jgi:hypothetical protein
MSHADTNPTPLSLGDISNSLPLQITWIGLPAWEGVTEPNRISKSISWCKKSGGGDCGGIAAGPDERDKGSGTRLHWTTALIVFDPSATLFNAVLLLF